MNFLSSVEAVITQIHLTSHAQVRVQQRGVDRTVLDCLLRYGRREFDHCGGQILRFDNAALYAVSRNESAGLWVKAVEAAGSTEVDAVREKMYGLEVPNLTGGTAKMLPNHHLTKPVLIGEIRADGQFDIISQTEPVPGDAWTDFLPESAVLEADWKDLKCGMYNTETKTCVQLKSNY